ncbi:MAG TPA: hypothetical protein VNX65_05370, partial [Patescibacteria group bacterium]|nr:hypothetical protein [Patescibacteria group bacterium]
MESYRQPNPSSEFQAQREDTTPKFTPPEQASNPHAGEGVVGEGQTDAELIDQDPFDRMLGLSPNETKPGAGEIFDGLSFDTSDKAVLPAGGVIGQIPERTDHEVGQDPEQASDLHPDEGVAREEQADAQLHDEDVDQDPFDRMLGLSPNETKPGAGEIFDGLSFDTSDK